MQFNGGEFHRPVMCYIPNSSRWTEGICVEFLLGESIDRRTNQGLSWYRETMYERVPIDLMPIAHCGGLDMVLLGIDTDDPNFGRVWFWDGTEEGEGHNIHWLADSFNEFLSMLQYDTYYEEQEHESIPIFQAIEHGKRRAVEQYLEDRSEVDLRNTEGLTLLAAAARYSWPKIVRVLLEHSADSNARDHYGRTPLHHAATHSYDSVKLLVAAGADVKARDNEGKSVLAGWSYRVDQYLRAQGAQD